MKSNESTDVTLVCDDNGQNEANRIVLSACSSFLAILYMTFHIGIQFVWSKQGKEKIDIQLAYFLSDP